MIYSLMESMVRQRLREKRGQVSCADCLDGRVTFVPALGEAR
jgi:hypothetical protein